MYSEQKIRDLTLKLIQILVWFEILWAIVFVIGMVFQWSGLTEQLSAAFFGSGFCAIIVLAALALLNLAANLNIISKAQMKKVAVEEMEPSPSAFLRPLLAAGVLISIVVGSLWFAEWKLYQTKVSQIEAKLESLTGTDLLNEAMELIRRDGPASELARIRDALATSIQTGASLSFIIPHKVKDITVYYEFTAWQYGEEEKGKKISQVSLIKFVPLPGERRKWQQLIQGEIDGFTVPVRDNLRTFRRVRFHGQELILLIDTARRLEYKGRSF